MDVAVDSKIPTYSGGLGVLAGDMLRSAADLEIPMVAVSLVHRKGYFDQRLDAYGNQLESPAKWSPENHLKALPQRVSVLIEGRSVWIRAWRYDFNGITGHVVPLFFLDADLPENDAADRGLTDFLFGGDERYRLCQEAILGLGGVAMLRELGYREVQVVHMNEGHSALATLGLMEDYAGTKPQRHFSDAEVEAVRRQCVFTTHTPVPAGHDRFAADLVYQVLGHSRAGALTQLRLLDGSLNMTEIALRFSGFVNGVSMRHGEVSRAMFPNYRIEAITNGVHAATWVSPPFAALYDRMLPEWRRDNCFLRYAVGIPTGEIRQVHAEAKKELLRVPFFGWAMWASKHIIVDRDDHLNALTSLRIAKQRVEAGISIVIFPEGRRSRNGSLLPFKKGGFLLAVKTGVPIVPVTINGSGKLLPAGTWRLRPGTVEVVVGDPVGRQQQGGERVDEGGLAAADVAGQQGRVAVERQLPDPLVEGAPVEHLEVAQPVARPVHGAELHGGEEHLSHRPRPGPASRRNRRACRRSRPRSGRRRRP